MIGGLPGRMIAESTINQRMKLSLQLRFFVIFPANKPDGIAKDFGTNNIIHFIPIAKLATMLPLHGNGRIFSGKLKTNQLIIGHPMKDHSLDRFPYLGSFGSQIQVGSYNGQEKYQQQNNRLPELGPVV